MTPDLPSLPDLPATNYRLGIEGNGYGSDDRLLFESGYSDEDMRSYGRACYELGARSTAAQPAGFKLLKDTTYEERSWPEDAAHENGNYSCCCVICLRQFTGHKRRVVCKVCYAAPPAAAQPAVPPLTRWYMNDNHTFVKLPNANDEAILTVMDAFDKMTYGMLCGTYPDDAVNPPPKPKNVHAGGREDRDAFYDRAVEWLDANPHLPAAPPAAAQPVEPTVTPTEAVVGFASWVTCRPGTLPAGEGHDAAPWSEAVHEFVVAQGWPTVRDVFPHNLKRPPLSAPPAASGDSTPPSATVQGDPSGALRTEPEEAGQGRWIAVTERMPENDDEVLVWVTSPWAKTAYAAIDSWHMHREDPTGMGGPTLEMGYMWREHEAEDITHWQRVEPPQAASVERGD